MSVRTVWADLAAWPSWRHWPATQIQTFRKDTKEDDFISQYAHYITALLKSNVRDNCRISVQTFLPGIRGGNDFIVDILYIVVNTFDLQCN